MEKSVSKNDYEILVKNEKFRFSTFLTNFIEYVNKWVKKKVQRVNQWKTIFNLAYFLTKNFVTFQFFLLSLNVHRLCKQKCLNKN